jgi:urease accessory protein
MGIRTAMCMARRMPIMSITEPAGNMALLRLMAWLSPAFPVGGFSYSHGLERAVHDGRVGDRESLADWLRQLLEIGSGWNDAVLFSEGWRRARDRGDPGDLAELAEALAGSRERHLETTLQGSAFLTATGAWPRAKCGDLPANCPYCVAVGAVAGAHAIPLQNALGAFLQAFVSNLVQAAIRLGVTGQSGGVAVLAGLEPLILATTARAAGASLEDLGSATVISDIMSMKHETQHSRLFRS